MKVIDLSMKLHTGMEVFPGDPKVEIDIVQTYEENTWMLRRLSLGSHTGTHVDAYSHMHQGKETLDEIPVEKFFGEAQVVEEDKAWPENIGLFFVEEIGIEKLDKLVDSNPEFVGGNITEDLERALLGKEIITYTGLVNLELIPEGKTFMFYGLPLRIQAGDGSPVRAIAIMEE